MTMSPLAPCAVALQPWHGMAALNSPRLKSIHLHPWEGHSGRVLTVGVHPLSDRGGGWQRCFLLVVSVQPQAAGLEPVYWAKFGNPQCWKIFSWHHFRHLPFWRYSFWMWVNTSLDCTMLRQLLSKQGNLPTLWAVQRWTSVCSSCVQTVSNKTGCLCLHYVYMNVYTYICNLSSPSTYCPPFLFVSCFEKYFRFSSMNNCWVSCLLEKIRITNGNICSLVSNLTPRRPTLTSKMKSVTSLLFISSSCV